MRFEVWVSFVACLVGIAFPLVRIGPRLVEGGFTAIGVAVFFAMPFAIVAGTTIVSYQDRRACRVLAVVALLILGLALAVWSGVITAEPFFLLFLPPVQLFVWLAGAVVSGRRRPA